MCAALGSRKISVEPHQIITTRSSRCSLLNVLMSSRSPSSAARLLIRLHVRAVEALHVARVERGLHRAHCAERLGDGLEVPARLEHARALRGDVRVVGERVPAAEHEVVELRERHEVLDQRHVVLGALAQPDRAHLRERPDRLAHPPLRELDAGDERARHRAHADREHTEASFDGLHHRRLDGRTFSGGHASSVGPVRTRCCTRAPASIGTRRPRASRLRPCARRLDQRGRASTTRCPRATRPRARMRTK